MRATVLPNIFRALSKLLTRRWLELMEELPVGCESSNEPLNDCSLVASTFPSASFGMIASCATCWSLSLSRSLSREFSCSARCSSEYFQDRFLGVDQHRQNESLFYYYRNVSKILRTFPFIQPPTYFCCSGHKLSNHSTKTGKTSKLPIECILLFDLSIDKTLIWKWEIAS